MQVWSWRLIFLLNLPIVLLILLLSPRIPESRAANDGGPPHPLDRLGAALATVSFAVIVYALSFAAQLGWRNPRVIFPFIGGLILLAVFLRSQSNRPNAMMPLSLFRIPRFLAANLLTFLLYGALGGALYVIPFYLIQVRHYPPAASGAVFLPLIAMMFFFSARVGALVPKVGERILLFAGPVLSGAGFAMLALLSEKIGYVFAVLPGVLLLGFGMTLSVAPLTNAVMSSVPQNQTGIASAVNNALSRLAGLIAVSAFALVLAHVFAKNLDAGLGRSQLPTEVRTQMLEDRARLHDVPIPATVTPEQHETATALLDQAFLSGFRAVMLACACSAWLGALSVLVLLRKSAQT